MTNGRLPIRKIEIRVGLGTGTQTSRRKRVYRSRRGFSTIDYVLILAVILPLVAFLFTIAPRMIQLVYEMTIVVIGTPLM
jgi:hypothetical protein